MHVSEWRFGNVTTRARECTILDILYPILKTIQSLTEKAIWGWRKGYQRWESVVDDNKAKKLDEI